LKLEQRKKGYKEGKFWDIKKEKVLLKTATSIQLLIIKKRLRKKKKIKK